MTRWTFLAEDDRGKWWTVGKSDAPATDSEAVERMGKAISAAVNDPDVGVFAYREITNPLTGDQRLEGENDGA